MAENLILGLTYQIYVRFITKQFCFRFLLHAKIIMNHCATVFGIAIVSLNIFTYCHTQDNP